MYGEPRPSDAVQWDPAEGSWIDPDAEAIPFGAEAVTVSYEGIEDELADRARRDGAKRAP